MNYSFTHQSLNESLFKLLDNTATSFDINKIYSYCNYLARNINIDGASFEELRIASILKFMESYKSQDEYSAEEQSPVVLFRTILTNNLLTKARTKTMKERLSHYHISEVEDYLEDELNIPDTHTNYNIDEEIKLYEAIKLYDLRITYLYLYHELSFDIIWKIYFKDKGEFDKKSNNHYVTVFNRFNKEKAILEEYFKGNLNRVNKLIKSIQRFYANKPTINYQV